MSIGSRNGWRFPMGRPVITSAAQAVLDAAGIPGVMLLARHAYCDWGELSVEDLAAHERALLTGRRLLSSYDLPGGEITWVITEADRLATTILLPDDY